MKKIKNTASKMKKAVLYRTMVNALKVARWTSRKHSEDMSAVVQPFTKRALHMAKVLRNEQAELAAYEIAKEVNEKSFWKRFRKNKAS